MAVNGLNNKPCFCFQNVNVNLCSGWGRSQKPGWGGGVWGGTPYNGLYRKAPSKRGIFSGFRYIEEKGFH